MAGVDERAGVQWRPATPADMDVTLAVQAQAHPLMQERAAVLADKLRLFPEGCRILIADGVPAGYAFAHPWLLDDVPDLDAPLGTLPVAPDCLFIHDVALLPAARGRGAGRAFVSAMAEVARRHRLATLALISVYGTVPVWERCGFRLRVVPGLAGKLAPFGPTARYMATAPAQAHEGRRP